MTFEPEAATFGSTFTSEPSSFPPLPQQSIEEVVDRPQHPRALESSVGTETIVATTDETLQLRTFPPRFEGFGLFTGPWLPPHALKLLEKLKKQPLSASELVKLMDILAQRAIDHFQLPREKFVAITFSGKIAELADTKLDLLRRIQSRSYPEQIFVWKVGSNSFSGRR